MEKTMELKKSDFYFDLPQELIAQDPLEDRSSSRLLMLDRDTGQTRHEIFHNIPQYLRPGDCLVLNNTKVIPARLLGEREGTGAHVEVLLLKRREKDVWETLVKPGKKCRPGTELIFGEGLLRGQVLETVEEGNRLIRFTYQGIWEEVLDQLGEMPLPPYITHKLQDRKPLPDRLCQVRRIGGGTHGGAAFYQGTVGGDPGDGRGDRLCDPACGAGHLSTGEGRKRAGASYAFRILSGHPGGGTAD